MKKTFLLKAWFIKGVISSVIVLFLFPIKFSLVVSLFLFLSFYIFRKMRIDKSHLDGESHSLILAPISGCISVATNLENNLIIRPKLLSGFGVIMPLKANIVDYGEESSKLFKFLPIFQRTTIILKLESIQVGHIFLKLSRIGLFLTPQVWVRGGDKAFPGSVIGNLPFGGTLEIIMESNMNILVNDKEKVEAAVTLVAAARTDENG